MRQPGNVGSPTRTSASSGSPSLAHRPLDEAVVGRVRHGGEEPAVEHDRHRAPRRARTCSASRTAPRRRRRRPAHDRRLTEARDPLDQQLEERVGVDVDPDVDVRRVGRSAPSRSTTVRPRQSSDSSSTSTFRRARLHEPGPDHVRDGDRVVDRRAVPAVRLAVVAAEEVVELGDERPDPTGRAQPLRDRRAEDAPCASRRARSSSRRARSWKTLCAASGSAPDVELGGGRDVALGDRAAHHHDALDAVATVQLEDSGRRS